MGELPAMTGTWFEDYAADGWPGLFRPLRHVVIEPARWLRLGGGWVAFAVCGSPCWPPNTPGSELPWCPACSRCDGASEPVEAGAPEPVSESM